jgi:single-strand DNA-binding protein
MRSVNKVILIGNLTRDPEMKTTQNGQTITTFGLATNREWTSNDERKKSTEFHECVAWANLGEICNKFLRKGKLIYVEGYIKTRSWETEEGDKRFRTEIVVQDMIMLEKRSDGSVEAVPVKAETEEAPTETEEAPAEAEEAPAEENLF